MKRFAGIHIGISLAFLTVFGFLLVAPAVWADGPRIEQDVMGPVANRNRVIYYISPDGEHIAVPASKGSQNVILIDGVEGPTFDQLVGAVVFSSDSAHSAYFAQVGGDCIVVLDGKELARGPAGAYSNLLFSAGGKHLIWTEKEAGSGTRLVVDGKPEQWGYVSGLITSADGTQYAYMCEQTDATGTLSRCNVLNGKQLDYSGNLVQFTPDGRLVVQGTDAHEQPNALLVDGKPLVQAPVGSVWVSKVGDQIAAWETPTSGGPSVLSINGQTVPATQGLHGAGPVYFSPDGKHYAALCGTSHNTQLMVIDGQSGKEYQNICVDVHFIVTFTPDSSQFAYVAESGGKFFVVTDGQESDGSQMEPGGPFVAGGHVAYFSYSSAGGVLTADFVVDGKVVGQLRGGGANFEFNSDGSHYAYTTNQYANGEGWLVDGRNTPIYHLRNVLFSPDGRHVAGFGSVQAANQQGGVLLDGKVVFPTPLQGFASDFSEMVFTPDSRHLLCTFAPQNSNGGNNTFYVDGKLVLTIPVRGWLRRTGPQTTGEGMSADGVLTVFAVPAGTTASIIRYRITPSSSIADLLAAAPAQSVSTSNTPAQNQTAQQQSNPPSPANNGNNHPNNNANGNNNSGGNQQPNNAINGVLQGIGGILNRHH